MSVALLMFITCFFCFAGVKRLRRKLSKKAVDLEDNKVNNTTLEKWLMSFCFKLFLVVAASLSNFYSSLLIRE